VSTRVLVVDDDPVIRRALASALGRAGYEVMTAPEAVPAMELVESFDAVVVDYNMVTATGADVVKHFKTRDGAATFCLVLSGDDDEHAASSCRAAGADAIMLKPALPSALRKCLADGLAPRAAA
jgi:two-component system, OmpR family, alkaline phosphatase synthesis response regulator PhoP